MTFSNGLLAAALLSLGGGAFAQGAQEPDVETEAQPPGKEVRTGLEEQRERVGEAGKEAAEGAEEAGRGVSRAIREGTGAIQGETSPIPPGELATGEEIRNTLTTDPVATVIGYGANVEYSRALENEKWSLVGGGRFARNRLGSLFVNNAAVSGGADYYVLGKNNEGLRIGPRLEVGFGGLSGDTSDTTGDTTFSSVAAGGELGYSWVASNGLTAGASAGLRGRLSGRTETTRSYSNATVGPYGRVHLGYSW